ncbi:MAG: dihydroorotate dehydrogenase [Chloroflexi bacterium RBG_13_50_21]|nr:MAG: dihydroorotate dehydrogenase [Chloroflexi bacterium RBG_13_50_21]
MIVDKFLTLSPILQALVATLFTWAITALGAGTVFLTRNVSNRFLNAMLGFAAGVMIAAAYWSLLAPSVELSRGGNLPVWLPPMGGFLLGGAVLWIVDRLLPHLHLGFPEADIEGLPTSWKRTTLLMLAVTLHNIPEGLAVGVAFGAAASLLHIVSPASAIALAVGIGIQNFPEGIAISLPLRREGMSMGRSFWFGQLSGMVEPLAGLVGAAAVIAITPILPYAMSFAAGAMFYVVVEELIPECQREGNTNLPTVAAMIGFAVMMMLELWTLK